jgi:hypothetical protein
VNNNINDYKYEFFISESRLFTFEDGLWNVRGRYAKACEEDEELFWSKNGDEHVAHILMASINLNLFIFIWSNWFGCRALLEIPLSLSLGLPPLLRFLHLSWMILETLHL